MSAPNIQTGAEQTLDYAIQFAVEAAITIGEVPYERAYEIVDIAAKDVIDADKEKK